MGFKAKTVGSVKSMKKSLARGGDGAYFKRVPKDGGLVVRFLQEPDEWVEYSSHFDMAAKLSFPCGDNCAGCASDSKDTKRVSKRFIAIVVDRDDNKVTALEMTKTLVSSLMKRYDKYSTMLDRDYELIREGESLNTTYDSIPEAPKKIKMEKYRSDMDDIDVMGMLETQYNESQNIGGSSDDDDDDDEPRRPRRDKASVRGGKKPRDDDEDEAPWDDDDDDDEDFAPRRKSKPAAKSKPSSKSVKKPMKKKR